MSVRFDPKNIIKKYNILSLIRDEKSTEQMTRIILIGSFIVDILVIALLCISFIALNHTYVLSRIVVGSVIFIYLIVISLFIHKKRIQIGAWMLVILYTLTAFIILNTWGVNTPLGILILGFVILLASVMLGAKHILAVTTGLICSLILLQFLSLTGISNPNNSMLSANSSYGDVAGYSIIFSIFAIIAWLSGTKTEKTLERAVRAENELQKDRDALVKRVNIQTKRITDSQQKELKQLYKFAELGQLTTIILHELANHLSVLTLDIDDIKERHQNSIAIEHAKESIFYIDSIIEQVRNQIRDSDDTKKFDALQVTRNALSQLRKKLGSSNIKLFVDDDKSKYYNIFGDPLRLSQAIIILVTNAAQANTKSGSEISIEISSTKSKLLISVKDFGKGITQETRHTLFQPQKNKKGAGLGIGLYVTKQIIDTHFKGKIWLSDAIEYTQFNIEIPIAKT